MDDTLYDLGVCNIDGSKLSAVSHFAATGVAIRSQTQEVVKEYKTLKVPKQIVTGGKEAFKRVGVEQGTVWFNLSQ